ncbi:DUF4233 domain-containing protein [Georgenia daeguensis]|uniref:DUF4233 domain-containing protein n=1 Tax=Georgenia daeguensis TaxID=908355 RepID=A0ABP8ESE8_9MICO
MSTPHETAPGAGAPQTPEPVRRPGSARHLFAMTVLVSELLVVLFATLVAHGLEVADRGLVWGVGGAAMVACAVAAGLLRRGRAGYVLGTAVQVLLIVSGLVVATMYVIGGLFAILWVVSLRVGGRIDTEREERYQAEVAHRAAAGGPTAGPTAGPAGGPTAGPTAGPAGGPTAGPGGGPVDGTSAADR